jgi:hypothetical protein
MPPEQSAQCVAVLSFAQRPQPVQGGLSLAGEPGAGGAFSDGLQPGAAQWPGGRYDVRVSAEGHSKVKSPRIVGQPGQMHDVGSLAVIRSGGVASGVVVDSGGKTVAGAICATILEAHVSRHGEMRPLGLAPGQFPGGKC